ncbi:MAG: two-component system sensor histidine kinase/response regulator [Rhodothermales bacterium]|jgi:two-component system sensor histidine kinase/response regulator
MMEENKRILIVDDNPSIHEDFKKILPAASDEHRDDERDELNALYGEVFGESNPDAEGDEALARNVTGYELSHALQGEDAFEMIREAELAGRPFALTFMDVRMPPGWDGIVTIREIWAEFPNIEVVICTAYSDYTWSQILKTLGTTDQLQFVRKPIDIVSIKQMALALTKKWNLAEQARNQVQLLESQVAARTQELSSKVDELQTALNEIHELRGILPMCSYCHKVRDDDDFWHQVDSYLQTRTQAEVSHGICPSCYETEVRPMLDRQKPRKRG